MRSYEAARSLFSFLGFIAWSVIIIGVLVALVGAGGGSRYGGAGAGLLAMVPGIAISIAGFIDLAFVQMGRATVDTAEYTQQMLKISRDQLEVSKQSLARNNVNQTSFQTAITQNKATTNSKGYRTDSVDELTHLNAETPKFDNMPEKDDFFYRMRLVKTNGREYMYDGEMFETSKEAKKYIDTILSESSRTSAIPSPAAEPATMKIEKSATFDPLVGSQEVQAEALNESIPDRDNFGPASLPGVQRD